MSKYQKHLAVGTHLSSLYSGSLCIASVGAFGVKSITVGEERGPMGFYATAVVILDGGSCTIYPLHMLNNWDVCPHKNKDVG